MKRPIFYSWQSDVRPAGCCRTLIQDALRAAVSAIGRDDVGLEVAIDRDTADVAGAPDIVATILGKIETAAAFVADVTIVNPATATSKAAPNPNVLVELGYALHCLGSQRVVLVQNTALGGPEHLPFDLRHRRVLTYASAPDAKERAQARAVLAKALEQALRQILKTPPPPKEVSVSLQYQRTSTSATLHLYELVASVTNNSRRRIEDWELELTMPTLLVNTGVTYASKDARRSDASVSTFRVSGPALHDPLRPGDARSLKIAYRIDNDLYNRRQEWEGTAATARATIDGIIAEEVERKMADLHAF